MAPKTPSTVAERIEELRTKAGLSKNKLSERCGFAEGAISRLTSAKDARENPQAVTVEIVAAALGASFDYVLRGVGPMMVDGIPGYWSFSRSAVAMRVLFARGRAVDDIEGAESRARLAELLSLPTTERTVRDWIEALESEIANPTDERLRIDHATAHERTEVARVVAQALASDFGLSEEEAMGSVHSIALVARAVPTQLALYRAALRKFAVDGLLRLASSEDEQEEKRAKAEPGTMWVVARTRRRKPSEAS